jgi:hypothetical protein
MQALARYFELDAEEADRLSECVGRYCESDVARRVTEAHVVMHEAPLATAVGGGRFVIAGSIDLYARSGDTALIVDYKSGTSGAHHELQDRYRLQADCYAFAALCDGCRDVEVTFVRPEVTRDGRMETVVFTFRSPDAERISSDLVCRYREIEESGFDPSPGQVCVNCDVPPGLCEHRTPRRSKAARSRS